MKGWPALRVISIGIPLADPMVDNHSLSEAPSLFEYDACVIEPMAVSREINEIFSGSSDLKTATGVPVQPVLAGPNSYGLGELLRQRHSELERLLQRGGLVVVFTYPNCLHGEIANGPIVDRYSFLPKPRGVLYAPPHLIAGTGPYGRTIVDEHPFSEYLENQKHRIKYKAHWNTEAITGFGLIGSVIGQSRGEANIAMEFRVGAGHIVFLPPVGLELKGAARRPFVESLLDSIQDGLKNLDVEEEPKWIRDFEEPNVTGAAKELVDVQAQAAVMNQNLKAAKAIYDDAKRFQGLLWRRGLFGFEAAVRDAFRLLGFSVSPEMSQNAVLREKEGTRDELKIFLEVESSDNTVSDNAYLRLRHRIDSEFLRTSRRHKGLLVVNGQRLVSPVHRSRPFNSTLADACEESGFALMASESLYVLANYVLEASGMADLDSIRQEIIQTRGLLEVREEDEESDK